MSQNVQAKLICDNKSCDDFSYFIMQSNMIILKSLLIPSWLNNYSSYVILSEKSEKSEKSKMYTGLLMIHLKQ